MPVGLWDQETLQLTGCYKTVLDAQKAKAMTEGKDPTTDPALFARGEGCSCCEGDCGCGDCEECKRADPPPGMGTMYTLPKTIAW